MLKGHVLLTQDSCVFWHPKNEIVIAVCVDDLGGKTTEAIDNAADDIAARFKRRSLGEISLYLGCRIARDEEQRKPGWSRMPTFNSS